LIPLNAPEKEGLFGVLQELYFMNIFGVAACGKMRKKVNVSFLNPSKFSMKKIGHHRGNRKQISNFISR